MKLFLIAIIFLALVEKGFSLKCYECSECKDNDKQCSNSGPSCFKAESVNKNGHRIINKGCGLPIGVPLIGTPENTCKNLTVLDVATFICTCLTDLCNNANVQMQSANVILTSIILSVLMRFM